MHHRVVPLEIGDRLLWVLETAPPLIVHGCHGCPNCNRLHITSPRRVRSHQESRRR
jgi:hypothetical protein